MDIKLSNMNRLFEPRSIAVIGASDKPTKLGFHVMLSLTKGGFPGRITPINPGSSEIMGLRAFPSIADLPGDIDLAIVVLPAHMISGIFEECLAKGVKGIVLITAGFKEIDDPKGADLHEQLATILNTTPVPVIGPNTFGMINLQANLNASFTPQFSLLKKGVIGLVSQSGGMCHLLSFLAVRDDIGFSKIVGIGNRLNVDFPEMVDYLIQDTDTEIIALYMEGIDRPRGLIETAKAHRGKKPIIAYKTGVGDIGNQASRSHTGSLAGRKEIYSGAFSQAGILGLDSVEVLLDTAKAMAVAPLPEGPSVAILSSQAGPGIAGADMCQMAGLRIVPFSPKTQQRINDILPPLALRVNPVDMGPAWYDSEATVGILQAVMQDEKVSGILLFMMFASANVDSIKGLSFLLKDREHTKPIITCLSAPPGIWDEHIKRYEQAGILVNFSTPERAATAMINLNRYRSLI
ncbi:MAG: CoA-binding protein [Deltaproteobacteria bacterium]|nr:MAG: CoA-binding protein [Deltaproteobacteria bacterium]